MKHGSRKEAPIQQVMLDRTKFEKQFVFSDGLSDEDFDHLRRLVEKRKDQRRKQLEAQLLEQAQQKKKMMSRQGMQFKITSNKPVKFTFNDRGGIIHKKKVDIERLPEQIVKGLEIKSVSKVKKLTVQKDEATASSSVASLKENSLDKFIQGPGNVMSAQAQSIALPIGVNSS